jgi:hypothetical protein
LAISFQAAQSLLMALICPPHSFGYFGINASKTKTSIEDNHLRPLSSITAKSWSVRANNARK